MTADVAPARAATAVDAKRAEQVADLMVEDVITRGWPVGEVIGSEAELLERYHVSRAVLREAVRLVEHQGVVRMRRGPGGGLVVTEPTVDDVIETVVLYLHRVDTRLDEVFEARIALEELATELASARVEEAELAVLRDEAAGRASGLEHDARALHSFLAEASGNPAVELFVEVLNRIVRLYTRDWRSRDEQPTIAEAMHAHHRIAEAVVGGDAGLARHRMRKHLEAEQEFLRRRRSTRELLPDDVVLDDTGSDKRAREVSRRLIATILRDGLEPGDLMGTEPELIEQHGVSRAVFREAVRLLEHHDVVRMRRGPGGGLFVVPPAPRAVTDVVAIYLARRGMRLDHLAELRNAVEVALVGLAAERVDGDAVDRMNEALEREAHSSDEDQAQVVHDLHAAVAANAGNRALELVALVLIRLSRLYQVERMAPRARKEIRSEVARAHAGIAAAVESGDRELARHRMKRHLDALALVVR